MVHNRIGGIDIFSGNRKICSLRFRLRLVRLDDKNAYTSFLYAASIPQKTAKKA